MQVTKERVIKNTDLIVRQMMNGEIRILDTELDEYITILNSSELENLIKVLGEFKCK